MFETVEQKINFHFVVVSIPGKSNYCNQMIDIQSSFRPNLNALRNTKNHQLKVFCDGTYFELTQWLLQIRFSRPLWVRLIPSRGTLTRIFGCLKFNQYQPLGICNVSSIQSQDSNQQSLGCDSPPLTTRPGLPPNKFTTIFEFLLTISSFSNLLKSQIPIW